MVHVTQVPAPIVIAFASSVIFMHALGIAHFPIQRWTLMWTLGCEKLPPGFAWLLLSKTGPHLVNLCTGHGAANLPLCTSNRDSRTIVCQIALIIFFTAATAPPTFCKRPNEDELRLGLTSSALESWVNPASFGYVCEIHATSPLEEIHNCSSHLGFRLSAIRGIHGTFRWKYEIKFCLAIDCCTCTPW